MAKTSSDLLAYFSALIEEADQLLPVLWEKDAAGSFTRIYKFPALNISSEKITIEDNSRPNWQVTVILYAAKDWNPDPNAVTFFMEWSSPSYILNEYSDADIKIFSSIMERAMNQIVSDSGFGSYQNTWGGDGKGELSISGGKDPASDAKRLVDTLEGHFTKIQAAFDKAVSAAE